MKYRNPSSISGIENLKTRYNGQLVLENVHKNLHADTSQHGAIHISLHRSFPTIDISIYEAMIKHVCYQNVCKISSFYGAPCDETNVQRLTLKHTSAIYEFETGHNSLSEG